MKSKGEEMSTCNIKLNVVLRVLKTKRSYSNLSVIIIIGDCALRRKKEEEREKWTWKGCLFCEVKCFNLWMKCPFLTDRNVKGAYTCQGTGVSVDPRNVPHISFLNWFKSNLTRLSDK